MPLAAAVKLLMFVQAAPASELCPLVRRDLFMTYELTIDQKPTYLHAIITGWNSKENVIRYMIKFFASASAATVQSSDRRALRRASSPCGIDVFEIASMGGGKARDLLWAMAYVDVNAVSDMMQFAETVAVNRSLPIAVFATVADAEKWLLSKVRVDAESAAAF